MADFIYPIATVVLDFICLLLCIRFIAKRHGAIWLIPLMLSIILLCGSAVCLLAKASNLASQTLSDVAGYVALFLFVLSTVWTITIIAFGVVTRPKDRKKEERMAKQEELYVRQRTEDSTYRKALDTDSEKKEKPITPIKAVEISKQVRKRNADLYRAGAVPTVSVRKTSFAIKEKEA